MPAEVKFDESLPAQRKDSSHGDTAEYKDHRKSHGRNPPHDDGDKKMKAASEDSQVESVHERHAVWQARQRYDRRDIYPEEYDRHYDRSRYEADYYRQYGMYPEAYHVADRWYRDDLYYYDDYFDRDRWAPRNPWPYAPREPLTPPPLIPDYEAMPAVVEYSHQQEGQAGTQQGDRPGQENPAFDLVRQEILAEYHKKIESIKVEIQRRQAMVIQINKHINRLKNQRNKASQPAVSTSPSYCKGHFSLKDLGRLEEIVFENALVGDGIVIQMCL